MSPTIPPPGSGSALKQPAKLASPERDEQLEKLLEEGHASFAAGSLDDAHGRFGQAHRRRPSDPRCQSWYGLTLILVEKNSNLGVRYCEEAVYRGGGAEDPDCWLNLGRAFLALGYRDRAVRAFEKGLEFNGDHEGLRLEMEKMGRRRKPVLAFLDRGNPLNRVLGRLRHKLSGPPAR